MTRRYQALTSDRDLDVEVVYYDEHRPGLLHRQGRWQLDILGRYWSLPQPRRWLRWAWRRLAGR